MCAILSVLLIIVGFGAFFGVSEVVSVPPDGMMPTPIVITVAAQFPTPTFNLTPPLNPYVLGTATPTINEVISICSPSTKSDEHIAAGVVGAAFDGADWTLTVEEADARTRYTWMNDLAGGLAFLDLVHFDCGYTGEQVASYATDEAWAIILSAYQTWEESAQCSLNDLRLFEFNVTFADDAYIMRYWLDPVNETRIGSFMLVFFADDVALMDEYAELVYPELSSCEDS